MGRKVRGTCRIRDCSESGERGASSPLTEADAPCNSTDHPPMASVASRLVSIPALPSTTTVHPHIERDY